MVTTTVSEKTSQTLSSFSKLSLGRRLALSTALIVSVVMGGISIVQLVIELKQQKQIHQELIKLSLTPLVVRLESIETLEALKREVQEFHLAYKKKNYLSHDVIVLDEEGDLLASTGRLPDFENEGNILRASISVNLPVLKGKQGTLIVLKDMEDYQRTVRQRWLLWAVHIAITVGVIFLFLSVASYFLVTKPVERLVHGVKKMEMGYWNHIDVPNGAAWEIRWLAWRFSNMVQEVKTSVAHLFEAEKKAYLLMGKPVNINAATHVQQVQLLDSSSESPDTPDYQELLAICKKLESASADDPQALLLAQSVWKKSAVQANRLGYRQIKARLEDAALRLSDAKSFFSLDNKLTRMKDSLNEWAIWCGEELCQELEKRMLPCAGVFYRVKHTAGVWVKMKSKELSIEEIHDLYAFRIIVPTETDCYAALGIIHQAFKPVVGRFKDYIVNPKANGYQSLHTCVRADKGPVFEVQIRSVAMDRYAERGDAAHWRYKGEKEAPDQHKNKERWWKRVFY